MWSRAIVVVVVMAGCGSSRSRPAGGDDAARGDAIAGPASGGRTDLLAHVPADTMYVLALRDDVPAPAWERIVRDLGPVVQRLAGGARDELAAGVDDEDRLELGLIAELADSDLLRPRAVLYDLRGVSVLRIQGTRPADLAAAVSRAGGGATAAGAGFRVQGATETMYVAATGGELVIARGPDAEMTAMASVLDGSAALPAPPLAADALDQLAAAHELGPYAVGYVDFARMGDRLRAAPGLLARTGLELPPTPSCVDAVATLLAEIPRLAIGAGEVTAERIELRAEIALDPAEAAALRAAQAPIAGLPLDGTPLIGFALAGSGVGGDPAWHAKLLPLIGRCKPEAALALVAGGFNSMRGVAAAIYDGKMDGFFPSQIDGYVALISDDLAEVMKEARGAGVGNGRLPADGAPFAKLSVSAAMRSFAPSAKIARRGKSLVFASGPTGRAHAEATFGTTTPAPFMQLIVDFGRIAGWQPANATTPSGPAADADRVRADDGLLADAGWSEAWRALLSTLAVTIETNQRGIVARVVLGLAPPGAVDPPPPPPSAEVRVCRRILSRAWRAAEPALARLGVTSEVAKIEDTYRTGLDTNDFAKACLALAPGPRACLLAAADPLAAAARCVADSSFELPPLFSFFGPQPLDDRWPDRRRVPLPDETAFVIPVTDLWPTAGWLVRDAAGCAAISQHGLVVPAICAFEDRNGARFLDVTVERPCPPIPAGTCTEVHSLPVRDGEIDTSR
jgi:hypothetical protein